MIGGCSKDLEIHSEGAKELRPTDLFASEPRPRGSHSEEAVGKCENVGREPCYWVTYSIRRLVRMSIGVLFPIFSPFFCCERTYVVSGSYRALEHRSLFSLRLLPGKHGVSASLAAGVAWTHESALDRQPLGLKVIRFLVDHL